ncbi:hypothetical protein HZA38_03190 [Candidatus Peregrinibacteria bacterium]|nr:hypothetical protein [Candidatus Peregrinibacteria bacterium]
MVETLPAGVFPQIVRKTYFPYNAKTGECENVPGASALSGATAEEKVVLS